METTNKQYWGWIALQRKLKDDPLWLGERFTKGQAWVDLLLEANHTDMEIIVGLKPAQIKRGQVFTSKVKLAKRWKWDRKTVTNFLQLLTNRQMVDSKTDRDIQHGNTVISIQNYNKYQFGGQQDGQINEQQSPSKTDTNNNDKNENNDKKTKELSFSSLESVDEQVMQDIATNFNISIEQVRGKRFELKQYCNLKGKTYPDYKLVLESFVNNDIRTGKITPKEKGGSWINAKDLLANQ